MVMGMAVSLVEGLVFLFFVRDMKASFTLCGLSVVVTVLFEIPIFAMAPKITKRFSHQTLLLIAHVAYIVRVVGYTFLPNPWLVLFLEPLHGVTYACFQISTVVYCSELAPDTMQATAQGLRSATLNIGSLIGYTLGSYVMENYGSVAMYRGSACLVFVTLCGCIIAVRTFSSSVNTYRETE
jgi:MFS transporter, PPP family, 3-phenylpropionic acid transporter